MIFPPLMIPRRSPPEARVAGHTDLDSFEVGGQCESESH
jgi:hypothetical protein